MTSPQSRGWIWGRCYHCRKENHDKCIRYSRWGGGWRGVPCECNHSRHAEIAVERATKDKEKGTEAST